MILIDNHPDGLLNQFEFYKASTEPKWFKAN